MGYEDAIAALADPSRRAILDRLRQGALPVGVIAKDLPISRPAVSQHLRILTDAGLLVVRKDGNRRLYALSPGGAADLRTYIDSLWGNAFDAYLSQAKSTQKEE